MQLSVQILAWFLTLAWVGKLLEAALGLRRVPNLNHAAHDLAPAGSPRLIVIVPARDEAAKIAACLRSLIEQDYAHLHILAVNDRSTDTTGAQMEALAAAHPQRLTVLHITELQPGWLGKTHAMAVAARKAIQEEYAAFLLFTDADILFTPSILRRSLAYAQTSAADHLVTLPTTLIETPGEAMMLAFLQALSLWAVRPWKIADARARDAIGVGAFNLLRASAYLQLGGFEAVRLEILEDLSLGRRVKAAGLRQRVAFAPGAVAVHWASGLFGILAGMTKNLFAVFSYRPALLTLGALWLAVSCVSPLVFMVTPGTHMPGALTCAAIAGLYLLSSRTSRIPAWTAVGFPVAAVLLAASMLRSMAITLRDGGVTWRGTFYPLAALRKQRKRTGIDADQQG